MNNRTRHIVLFCLIMYSLTTFSRDYVAINASWLFQRSDWTAWQSVDLPHSWNTIDVLDDQKGYFRGEGYYKKSIAIDNIQGKHSFLFFEGVGQQMKLWVNDEYAGEHLGGYTSFVIEISPWVKQGENTLFIEVSNANNPNLIPLEADFNFYGGIYRDVYFYQTGESYFYSDTGISNGIQFDYDLNQSNFSHASVTITSTMKVSDSQSLEQVTANYRLIDSKGHQFSYSKKGFRPINDGLAQQKIHFEIDVTPWSPENPERYQLVVETSDDQVRQQVGFVDYFFNEKKQFVLNGQVVKLIGANRHQDEAFKGNALNNSDHRRDMQLMADMGINFMRISHYPQDPEILALCDSLGIIAIEEIPFVNEATVSQQFADNTVRQMEEMIERDYNHVSLVAWGISNELTLRLNDITKKYSEQQRQEYIDYEIGLISRLNNVIHQKDKKRHSFNVLCCGLDRNRELGYHTADIIGYNLYYGWYERHVDGLTTFLNEFAQKDEHPFFLSEYGAGSDPRIRSSHPRRFDFSIEWQNQVHQRHLQQILISDQLFGSALWNFIDFQAEHRNDAVPKINSKGLVTVHRVPKDAYYYYQAALSKEPILVFPAQLFTTRAYLEDENGLVTREIELYGNSDEEVELFHDGTSLGKQKFNNYKSDWSIPFHSGKNILEAKTAHQSTRQEINVTIYPKQLTRESLDKGLAINCGAHFSFHEEVNGSHIWLEDKAYEPGNYGYIGGKTYYRDGKELVGSAHNILNTSLDPIYQTHRYNINQYKVDVPAGDYVVELHFAEVIADANKKEFLKREQSEAQQFNRDFQVFLNDRIIIDYKEVMGEEEFLPKIVTERVTTENGLTIHFNKEAQWNYISALKIKSI